MDIKFIVVLPNQPGIEQLVESELRQRIELESFEVVAPGYINVSFREPINRNQLYELKCFMVKWAALSTNFEKEPSVVA